MDPGSRLRYGPYSPPPCQVGDALTCALRGKVKVIAFSSGRIAWPMTAVHSTRSLIVCGSLLRAVRRETRRAVAYWWGIRIDTVARWRRALRDPVLRASLLDAKRRAVLRAAAKLRRPVGGPRVPLWKPEWDALLGSEPDRKLAQRLGVNRDLVFRRRKGLGMRAASLNPSQRARKWNAPEDALLGTRPDREVAEQLGCSLMAVFWRRQKLGVPPFRARKQNAAR